MGNIESGCLPKRPLLSRKLSSPALARLVQAVSQVTNLLSDRSFSFPGSDKNVVGVGPLFFPIVFHPAKSSGLLSFKFLQSTDEFVVGFRSQTLQRHLESFHVFRTK